MTDTNKSPSLEQIQSAYQFLREGQPWRHKSSNKVHHHILPSATYAPWFTDEHFLSIYKTIKSQTLVDLYRCFELWTLAKQIADIDGDVLEVGVWRGGTGAILAEATRSMKGKIVYLADTFSGVVKAGENDTNYKGGEHSDASVDMVNKLMASLSIENIEILKGIFPEDTNEKIRGKISMLHCDVDVYTSSKDIVEWCIPRLSIGSILVFDDYGFFGCEGVTTFCEEFRSRKGFHFLHNLNGHAIFIKISD